MSDVLMRVKLPLYIVAFCRECERTWLVMIWDPPGMFPWVQVVTCMPCMQGIDVCMIGGSDDNELTP